MTEFLLLLSLFHHHKAFTSTPDGCDAGRALYFYTGDDRVGISGASCEGAKDDWRKAHINPVRMSRA